MSAPDEMTGWLAVRPFSTVSSLRTRNAHVSSEAGETLLLCLLACVRDVGLGYFVISTLHRSLLCTLHVFETINKSLCGLGCEAIGHAKRQRLRKELVARKSRAI